MRRDKVKINIRKEVDLRKKLRESEQRMTRIRKKY